MPFRFATPSQSGGNQAWAPIDERTSPRRYMKNDITRLPRDPWQPGALWSVAQRFVGAGAGDGAPQQDMMGASGGWDVMQRPTGGQQRKRIIGTTRDGAGAVLGSCIVQGFRTSDDLFAGEMTSDTAGYFEFCTSMTENHYLVAYKAGSPDVAGTTVNTLAPV